MSYNSKHTGANLDKAIDYMLDNESIVQQGLADIENAKQQAVQDIESEAPELRQEVAQLSQKVDDLNNKLSGNGELTISDADSHINAYINASGMRSDSSTWDLWQFNFNEGVKYTKVKARLWTNSTSILLICFYDQTTINQYHKITYYNAPTANTYQDIEMDVPEGAKMMTACTKQGYEVSVSLFYESDSGIEKQIQQAKETADAALDAAEDARQSIDGSYLIPKEDADVIHAYIQSNGSLINSDSWTTYKFTTADVFQKVKARLWTNSVDFYSIAYYKVDGTAQTLLGGDKCSIKDKANDFESIVPKDCNLIIVAQRTASSQDYYIEVYAEKSDSINQRITRLENVTSSSRLNKIIYPNYEVKLTPNMPQHGRTIVEGNIWAFKANRGTSFGGGVYDIDTYSKLGDIDVKFIYTQKNGVEHSLEMKSVDYNPKNKCLLVGNGSSTYTEDDSYIYAFHEIDAWVDSESQITFDNCGAYAMIDVTELGAKSYAWWAEIGNQNDMIFVNVNALEDIYLIRLGRGSKQLSKGVYVNKGDKKFNGTYDIVKHWHQDVIPNTIQAHDGQYYKGHLIIASNEQSRMCIYDFNLMKDGGIEINELICEEASINSDTGKLEHAYPDGLCIHNDKIYTLALTVGGYSFASDTEMLKIDWVL